ncbi:MAG: helix-turn-helix domain-containing protein, partial [Bacteroidota bacterium]
MPRIKQFDEQQALEQAMELFWEKGFHATSMQDLVSRLGINRASLYDTFGGKQALFDRALALYRQKNQSGAREFVRPFASVREGLTALFDQAIEEAACDLE